MIIIVKIINQNMKKNNYFVKNIEINNLEIEFIL